MALRGASAEAVTELSGMLGAGGASLADLATAGDQLFAVAEVLRREPALRRFATDTTIDSEAKAGLAEAVFGKALDERALGVVRAGLQRRWTSPHDLAVAFEELAVTAVARSAGARADQLSDELFAVGRVVDGAPELRGALADSTRTVEDRRSLVAGLLDGKVLPATEVLVAQAIGSDRGPFASAVAAFQRLVAAASDEVVAVVRTARPLAEADVERLAGALGRQYAASVHVQVVEDSSLIGGLLVEIGDDVIDGSVSSRLDEARRKLAG